MNSVIADSDAGYIVSFVIWTISSIFIWHGALLGSRQHSTPRIILAMVTSSLAVLYLLDAITDSRDAWIADARRGVSWVMALVLCWVAATGLKYGRRINEITRTLQETQKDIDDP